MFADNFSDLLWQLFGVFYLVLTEYKRENVRDGQVGEVDVCGVPDVIIQELETKVKRRFPY